MSDGTGKLLLAMIGSVALSAAGVVGTITWGFGDIFAPWFGAAAR